MNDKIYESCQYLALGLLVGYFGKYVLDWMKDLKNKNSKEEEPKNSEELNHV